MAIYIVISIFFFHAFIEEILYNYFVVHAAGEPSDLTVKNNKVENKINIDKVDVGPLNVPGEALDKAAHSLGNSGIM